MFDMPDNAIMFFAFLFSLAVVLGVGALIDRWLARLERRIRKDRLDDPDDRRRTRGGE
jgi:hypothetical protein